MANKLTRFLLLPSLLLANAYLTIGGLPTSSQIQKINSYSEKVKDTNPELNFQLQSPDISNEINYEQNKINIVLTLLFVSIVSSLIYIKKNNIFIFKKYKTLIISTQYKLQNISFNHIKTIRKTFHCSYYKIYINSFSLTK